MPMDSKLSSTPRPHCRPKARMYFFLSSGKAPKKKGSKPWRNPAVSEYLIEHWRVPCEKIDIVENGVETELFAPASHDASQALRQQLGADSKFVTSYIGTIGNAHGLETLLDAAAPLQTQNSDVLFFVIGEGAEKERIKALAQSHGLTNVRF